MVKHLMFVACLISSTAFGQNASSLQPIPPVAKPAEAPKAVAPPIDESLHYDRRYTGRLNLSNREFKATVKEQQRREGRMSEDSSLLKNTPANNPVKDQAPAPPLKTLSQANSAGINPAAKPVPDAPPVARDYSLLKWSALAFVLILVVGGTLVTLSNRRTRKNGED